MLRICQVLQCYAVVTTTIRLRFDGRSTTYQRSSRSQWRNRLCRSQADLFIYLDCSAAVHIGSKPRVVTSSYGRIVRSNCSRMGVERRSNRSRIVIVTAALELCVTCTAWRRMRNAASTWSPSDVAASCVRCYATTWTDWSTTSDVTMVRFRLVSSRAFSPRLSFSAQLFLV